MTLALTEVIQDGKTTPIVTNDFVQEAENTKKKDAMVVGGAAAIGSAIGALAGGKNGALGGAAIGGGAGAGTVLETKGKQVEFGSEARLQFTLEKSIGIAAAKKD